MVSEIELVAKDTNTFTPELAKEINDLSVRIEKAEIVSDVKKMVEKQKEAQNKEEEDEYLNEDISIRRKAAEGSILAFAKLYFPHHLKVNPSEAHNEVYELLLQATNEKGKKIAIAAPREFGKSTMITLIYLYLSYLLC